MILIDSDVLIWVTRGHDGARTRLAQINPWRISVITYMELAQKLPKQNGTAVPEERFDSAADQDIAPYASDFGSGHGPG